MRLPVSPQQNGKDIGDAFKAGIQDLVNNALAQAQTEIQVRLDGMRAERAGLEAALNSQTSAAARRGIQSRIDRLDRDISETEAALEKVQNKVNTRVDQRTFTETRPPVVPPITRVDPTEI